MKLHRDYLKLTKVLDSCITFDHLLVCNKMWENYILKYAGSRLALHNSNMFERLFDRKRLAIRKEGTAG